MLRPWLPVELPILLGCLSWGHRLQGTLRGDEVALVDELQGASSADPPLLLSNPLARPGILPNVKYMYMQLDGLDGLNGLKNSKSSDLIVSNRYFKSLFLI